LNRESLSSPAKRPGFVLASLDCESDFDDAATKAAFRRAKKKRASTDDFGLAGRTLIHAARES
jgi:hypothetical protein